MLGAKKGGSMACFLSEMDRLILINILIYFNEGAF
jgi:hypothetical protein